jgi:thiamine pyrophosphokinase
MVDRGAPYDPSASGRRPGSREGNALRALVVANGEMPSKALLRALAGDASLVVAADGGVRGLIAAGIKPDAVVGDLDSLDDDARAQLGKSKLVRDADPDHTDIEKAIAYCVARGATRVDVAGAGGGRADHALANLSVIFLFRGRAEVHVVDDLFDVRAVDGETAIEAPAGTVVSLVAVGPVEGLTTQGLRWDLRDHALGFSPLGVHNEVVRSPARVRVHSGDLLVFEGRWVERHG